MTPQAEIAVPLQQKLWTDRTVGRVADGAAFPHRFVLEDERPALVPVALCTRFIQARHRQTASRFEDCATMRIVALDAIHPAFDNRVMVGQVQLGVDLQMTLIANRGIFSRIDDELPTPAAA